MLTNLKIRTVAIGVLAAAGLCTSAQATFFSFASDNNDTAFTFAGTSGSGATPSSFTLSNEVTSSFSLRIDDNNGPAPEKFVQVRFVASLTATHANSEVVIGSQWRHSYAVTGSFQFNDAITGNALLTVSINSATPALLTVPGTENAWSSTGAILGADSFSSITYVATDLLVTRLGGAATAAMYGIIVPPGGQAASVGPDDFGFDLSVINTGQPGNLVGLNAGKTPTTSWKAESSFSGSAVNGIPTPGAMAMLGMGLVAIGRRRRR